MPAAARAAGSLTKWSSTGPVALPLGFKADMPALHVVNSGHPYGTSQIEAVQNNDVQKLGFKFPTPVSPISRPAADSSRRLKIATHVAVVDGSQKLAKVERDARVARRVLAIAETSTA